MGLHKWRPPSRYPFWFIRWCEWNLFFYAPSWVSAIRFSPDDRTLIVAHGRLIELWDIETKKRSWELSHTNRVTSITVHLSGNYLVAEGTGTGVLWDLKLRKIIHNFASPHELSSKYCFEGDLLVKERKHYTTKIYERDKAWDLHPLLHELNEITTKPLYTVETVVHLLILLLNNVSAILTPIMSHSYQMLPAELQAYFTDYYTKIMSFSLSKDEAQGWIRLE